MIFQPDGGPRKFQKSNKLILKLWLLTGLLLMACGNVPIPTGVSPQSTVAEPLVIPTATPVIPTPTPVIPTLDPKLPLLSNPVIHSIDTPYNKDLSSDGFNWAEASPIQVDKYNNIFTTAQQNNSGDVKFIYSNDNGLNWSENETPEKYFTRGTMAYDARNDLIHVLWTGASSKDGIIYRRYNISRDSSHNITGITRQKDLNLQLDFEVNGKMHYEHPILLWLDDKAFGENGALVAIWSARNEAGPITNVIRVSQRILSDSADDNLAANWRAPLSPASSQVETTPAPATAATTTSPGTPTSNPAQVAYSLLFSNSQGSIPYASAMFKTTGKHARDLYFFYSNGNDSWEWRRAEWNSATGDWSGKITPPVTISKIIRAGSDTGYNLKQQLGTKPVEDTVKDRVYFGFATWKDNSSGDTWSHVFVDASDNLSEIADVYSAGKAHTYAPTGDITFDQTLGRLVTAYLKTDKAGIYLRTYDGISATGEEILVFKTDEGDIPLLWQGGRYLVKNQPELLILFRGTTRPYQGYFGTLDWLKPAS